MLPEDPSLSGKPRVFSQPGAARPGEKKEYKLAHQMITSLLATPSKRRSNIGHGMSTHVNSGYLLPLLGADDLGQCSRDIEGLLNSSGLLFRHPDAGSI